MPHIIGVKPLYKITVRIADRFYEVRRQLLHVLVAPVGTLLAALENDLVYTVRNIRVQFPGRGHRFLDMLDRDRDSRIPVKRDFAGKHLIQRYAQRIDVALFIAEAASRLFGRSIMNRAHHIRGDRVTGCRLSDTKIRDLNLSLTGNDDVLGLNIPVNDVVAVRRLQSHGDLQRDRNRLFVAETASLRDIALERDPVHELHDNIINPFFLADVIDVYDIGMHKTRCSLCLYAEFRDKIRVLRELLLEHLDRHIAVQCVVF